MPRKEVPHEVDNMLQDLQLTDKTKTAARNLSGGMKRKLRYIHSASTYNVELGVHLSTDLCVHA